jgi:hypothetical protein
MERLTFGLILLLGAYSKYLLCWKRYDLSRVKKVEKY